VFAILIEAIITAFSWGIMFAVVAVVQGLFFCWFVKPYRRTLIIANIIMSASFAAFSILVVPSSMALILSALFIETLRCPTPITAVEYGDRDSNRIARLLRIQGNVIDVDLALAETP